MTNNVSMPVVFNIGFTDRAPPRNATQNAIDKWQEERNFFTCNSNMNIEIYINDDKKTTPTKDKSDSRPSSIVEYMSNANKVVPPTEKTNNDRPQKVPQYLKDFEPNAEDSPTLTDEKENTKKGDKRQPSADTLTRAFNLNGNMTEADVEKFRKKAQKTKSIVWHGYISFDSEVSKSIHDNEAQQVINRSFKSFLKNAGFAPDNINLICNVHYDHAHHTHIHFAFFEDKPQYMTTDGRRGYRCKGTIPKQIIQNFRISASEQVSEHCDMYFTARDKVIAELHKIRNKPQSSEELLNQLTRLETRLPRKGRLQYNSDNVAPYRKEIDTVALALLAASPQAWRAHLDVLTEIGRKEKEIKEYGGEASDYIKNLRNDYYARLGNNVLGLIKQMRYLPKDPLRTRGDRRFGGEKRGRAQKRPTDKQRKAHARVLRKHSEQVLRDILRLLPSRTANIQADYTRELERAEMELRNKHNSGG